MLLVARTKARYLLLFNLMDAPPIGADPVGRTKTRTVQKPSATLWKDTEGLLAMKSHSA